MRRYSYIIIAIIIVIVIVVAVLLIRSRSASTVPSSSVGTNGFLPTVGTEGGGAGTAGAGSTEGGNASGTSGAPSQAPVGKFGVVFGEPVLNYFVDTSNTVVAVEPDGKIAQISGGQSTYLSSAEIANVMSVEFSYDGKKILVGFGELTSPQWSVFNVAIKAWTPLTVNTLSAAWSPSNYQIAYFAASGGVRTLQTLDLGDPKAKPKSYLSMPSEDFTLLWPVTSTIFFSDRASAFFSGSIFAFDLKTASLATIVQGRVGLEARWNTDGTMGLVLAGTNLARGGQLGIVDGAGNLLHLMTFLTLPSKCVFTNLPSGAASSSAASSTTPQLICGIPRDTSKLQNNPLPDAYEEKLVTTADGIYRVSLANGNVTALWNDQTQNMDLSDVALVNNTLFFVNRYDQKLYALSLGQ